MIGYFVIVEGENAFCVFFIFSTSSLSFIFSLFVKTKSSVLGLWFSRYLVGLETCWCKYKYLIPSVNLRLIWFILLSELYVVQLMSGKLKSPRFKKWEYSFMYIPFSSTRNLFTFGPSLLGLRYVQPINSLSICAGPVHTIQTLQNQYPISLHRLLVLGEYKLLYRVLCMECLCKNIIVFNIIDRNWCIVGQIVWGYFGNSYNV